MIVALSYKYAFATDDAWRAAKAVDTNNYYTSPFGVLMHNSTLPLARLLLTGSLLLGLTACDDGGSANTPFNLSPEQLPTNAIVNGSLEDSTTELTGWDAYTAEGSTAEAEFTVDTAEVFRGNNSFKASIAALGDQPYHIEAGPINVPIEAGGFYALVAWAKGPEGGKANFTASLEQEPWTTFGNLEVDFTGEWQQVVFTFALPENLEVDAIRLPVQMSFEGNAGADIYIDDMQLVPTNPPPPPPAGRVDLVTNGGLEASDTSADNWGSNANSTTAAGTTFSVDSTEAYEGSNSFKVSFGTVTDAANPWEVEAGATGVPVMEGETYTFSAWVKGSTGARANFIVQLPGAPYHTFEQREVVVTSEWQQVTFDVLIEDASAIEGYEGPTEQVRLYMHGGYPENSGAEIYIDNVQLLTQGAELVTNGGLEESDTSTTAWGSGANETTAPGTTFSVTSAESRTGSNSLHVSVGTVTDAANPWEIEAGPTGVPVAEGEEYVFSAWVKGTPGAAITFNVQLQEAPYHSYANPQVELTSDWQQVTFEVLIADASTIDGYDGPTEEVRLYMHMGYPANSGADIYIDDVSLMAK